MVRRRFWRALRIGSAFAAPVFIGGRAGACFAAVAAMEGGLAVGVVASFGVYAVRIAIAGFASFEFAAARFAPAGFASPILALAVFASIGAGTARFAFLLADTFAVSVSQRLPGQLFNGAQERTFLAGAKGDCRTRCARAAGAADAVSVGFRRIGQVVIHHMGDVLHVDAAGGDIRRHEDARLAIAEGVKRLFTLDLGAVAVNGVRRRAGGVQHTHDLVGAMLGA